MKPSSSHTPPSTPPMPWIPKNYRDPMTIPQIPIALAHGGSIDIPHASSVIGLHLIQWGSSFSASLSEPAHSLAELHKEMEGQPPTTRRSVQIGPLSLSGHRNIYGSFDYEIGLRLGRHTVMSPDGIRVEFSRSITFRGKSLGPGMLNRAVTFEYNYLDYTAEAPTPALPATTAQAGYYVKIMPWRLALAAATVGVIVAAGYGLWQIIDKSPLGNPSLVPGR